MNRLFWVLLIAFITAFVTVFIARANSRIINGTPVETGEYTEVVSVRTNNAGCTASVVGPKVLLTAAHCAKTGATSVFTVAGVQYSALITRHPDYPQSDYDIALGVIDKEVADIKPATIYSGNIANGDRITILGYGCTQPGGSGGNDGILRKGTTLVTGFSSYDIISQEAGGAALCYGDSGGPVFIDSSRGYQQAAVNSKGNIKDTNYTTNLTLQKVKDFFKSFTESNGVEICGVNKDCQGPVPEKFTIENLAVKVDVENKGMYETDYLKTYFGYLMSFLDDGNKTTLPIPEGVTDLPHGFCNCGSGWMAACDVRGVGECNNDKWCFCEGMH